MRVYRYKEILWVLLVLVSMLAMALGFRAIHNGTAVSIFYVYSMSLMDAVLFGLILPVMSLLMIVEVNGWMVSSKVLALNSRIIWWKEIKKKLMMNCFISVVIILLPVFLLTNIFMGAISTSGEWVYMLFLFLTYFLYFYLLALCIVVLEIKCHQSLLTVSFVLFVSFLPNIFSFLFRAWGLPTLSGVLNLSYALVEGRFYWFQSEKVCVLLLFLFIFVEKTGKYLWKRQDIYWH